MWRSLLNLLVISKVSSEITPLLMSSAQSFGFAFDFALTSMISILPY